MKAPILCLAALSLCNPARAHDLWLAVDAPRVAVGDTFRVGLRLGEAGVVEKIELRPERTERLWLSWAGNVLEVPIDRPHEAIQLQARETGTYTVAFLSQPSSNELSAQDFDAYLEEEHLSHVIKKRRAARSRTASESESPVREKYSRSLKSLIGAGQHPLQDCPRQLPLELQVIEADARRLVVRASFEGAPLAGLWVDSGDPLGEPLEEHRTDRNGLARFKARSGDWVLRATHMRAATQQDAGFDWRSWWATTSFRITAAGVVPCAKATLQSSGTRKQQ